jgi:predicted transcriptional regulator
LLVRDLMTVGVPTCPPDTTVGDLTRMLLEKDWEAVVVLDGEEGHALGVVSQLELVRAYARPDAANLRVDAIMREGVPEAPPEIPLAVAAQLMLDQGVRAIYMMHHSAGINYPAAVLTFRHVLRHLAARDDAELRDLGIAAARKTPIEVFIERREAARKRNLGHE